MPNEIFYVQPQPQQPRRYAPIPSPGGAPPPTSNVRTMANVLASWPTGTEYQPYQRYRTAPIPAQGVQPRSTDARMLATVLASWPTGVEYQPYQRYRTVPIPSAGSQPQPTSTSPFFSILNSWNLPAPQPWQQRIAAPIPVVSFVPFTRLPGSVLSSWEVPFQSAQRLIGIAPLAQTYGNQPPAGSTASLFSRLGAWQYQDSPQQMRIGVAAITIIIRQPAFTRLPESILASWQPADVRFRFSTFPTASIAPPSGSTPPPTSIVNMLRSVLAWPTGFEYQAPQLLISTPIPALLLTGTGRIARPSHVLTAFTPPRVPTSARPRKYGNQ